MENIKFDFSQIPEVEARNLARAFYEAAKRFYEDPENVRKFEEWKKARE